MRECRVCESPRDDSDFYLSSRNVCKPCRRKQAREYRQDNLERVREYDRKRGCRLPDGYLKRYRELYPNKYKAHNTVNNAIRDQKLFKEPCCECGTDENVHAHHDDYLKPLNVRWLCAACHKQWHVENGEALNP